MSASPVEAPLVSVVLPCLDEEQTLGVCINKIRQVFSDHHIHGEIIVSDNGSTDRSMEIAEGLRVQVVREPARGYGNAYLRGFSCARGRYLVMVDADNTYDFNEIPHFLKKMVDERYDFVSGNRYQKGVEDKAMSFSHRYIGNPLFTRLLNYLFNTKFGDVNSGFKAFSREAYERIRPISPGMEFCVELAISAKLSGLRMAEIPIRLHRRVGKSKLCTFRDGWRTLRIMLLYCPNKVFLGPGVFLFCLGLTTHLVTLLKLVRHEGRALTNVTGIFATIFTVVGFEIISLGLHAKTYSWTRHLEKSNELLSRFYALFTMEKGLLIGSGMFAAGAAIMTRSVVEWLRSELKPLPDPEWVSFAATLIIIGCNVIFSSVFISAMSMKRSES